MPGKNRLDNRAFIQFSRHHRRSDNLPSLHGLVTDGRNRLFQSQKLHTSRYGIHCRLAIPSYQKLSAVGSLSGYILSSCANLVKLVPMRPASLSLFKGAGAPDPRLVQGTGAYYLVGFTRSGGPTDRDNSAWKLLWWHQAHRRELSNKIGTMLSIP